MNYSVSVVLNNQLFRLPLLEGKRVEISPSDQAEVTVPNLGHTIFLIAENRVIRGSDIGGSGEEVSFILQPNIPRIVDETHRIALCVSEALNCERIAWLGKEFSITLGRVDAGTNGRKNDIVLSSLPFVSRTHFKLDRRNGVTTLTDLGSTNGVFVNGERVKQAELCRDDEISILTAHILYKEDYLQFENTGTEPELAPRLCHAPEAEGAGTELFKRSPRIQERLPGGKIEIPAPPTGSSKPEINWLSTLLPAGVTIAIAVVMALAFNNTTTMLYSLPMTVAGVVVSVVSYLRAKKKYQKDLENQRTAYLQKLDAVKSDIQAKREAQKAAMLLADPSPEECLHIVKSRSTKLWCREPDDSDFASVRIGVGTVPFSVGLEQPREQQSAGDELSKMPREIYQASSTIEGMPVLCNLRSNSVIGLLGAPEATRTQLQNMIFHLTTHHCCNELKIVCLYNEKDQEELSWLANLPHTHGAAQEESYLACSQEKADELFRTFSELFKQRKEDMQENSRYGSSPTFVPHVIFAFFEPYLLKKSDPINRYLFMERELGVSCLMATTKMAQLPKQCTEIITLELSGGEIYSTASATERYCFQPDEISPALRCAFGLSMKPLYCDEGIDARTLPKSFSLFQMLGVNTMAEFDIGKSWRSSDLLTSKTAPSAPIGIQENGKLLPFNSPPTGEDGGAHALVAGTTGSGKSETLLTLILSLALRYPPDEVSFLVIDFKGDSLAGRLKNLPHLRGVITNLDGSTLARSLVSITAENDRRQKLFQEYKDSHPEEKKQISDIRDYTQKYKEGKVTELLPHLFIVVDEFAEMKKRMPEIMEQFLSVARIGRSLGVHLILATQSPSGVVDNKIRDNMLKQLCLKVANTGESKDMIGSDLAARIKDAGRGYLKVDNNLYFFQSAYGGGKLVLSDGSESTQIGEAVEAIASYCRAHGIRKLPDVFCPPLPNSISYQKPREPSARRFGWLPIGIRDDPARQFMGTYAVDVFSSNTLIIGSQMMGKTNLLQTILRGTAELYSPEEVNVYILEFSSLFLKSYESLPHVGGVVTIQEMEKIKNLFQLLAEQKELRRQRFLEVGVSTFAAYRESGKRDFPQILLLVDDLAAAKAYFPLDDDPLLRVCKDGLSLGISVVATAAQAVGEKSYLPTFANRVVLYNNDPTVYSSLLKHTSLHPKQNPGRGLVEYEDTVYELQCFLAFEGKREIDRTEAVRGFCREQTAKANGKCAVPIPFIPDVFTANEAITAFPNAYSGNRLMFGLDYATVKPLSVKLASLGMLAISGRERDVQNFQRYLLTAAHRADGLQAEFYIVDSIERPLQPFSQLPCVAEYGFLPELAPQLLHKVCEKAAERYSRLAGGDTSILDTAPVLVLMLNSSEAINAISANKAALEEWLLLTGKLKAMNVCTVFGALDNASIPFGAEVLKKFKENRKLIFFDSLNNLKIGDLPYATVKKFPGGLKKGDGYLIIGNDAARIRVPDCPLPESE